MISFRTKVVTSTAITSCLLVGLVSTASIPAVATTTKPNTAATATNKQPKPVTPSVVPSTKPSARPTDRADARPSDKATPKPPQTPKPAPSAKPTEPAKTSFYSINGFGNNLTNPSWGSFKTGFSRLAPAAYGDGVDSLAGANRPSARVVSNTVDAQATSILNARGLTDMTYVFGQFLDHDITRAVSTKDDSRPIAVPTGDPQFDPSSTGTATIPFTRSTVVAGTGRGSSTPRVQENWVTSFIDGSQIYGSTPDRARALRTMSGGLMKTSAGNMLPLNTAGLENDNDAHVVADTQLFLAGDVRANENPGLISMHTLFVREHNRLAKNISAANPRLNDEQIYQRARQLVIAELQWIVYNEYLPALLGSQAMPAYSGYSASVNPSIANEFSTAAYRFGHSMLDGEIGRLNNDGSMTEGGPLQLASSFFNPTVFDATKANHAGDIDPFIKSETTSTSQEIDVQIDDSVRNFLFGPPGAGGLDLAALNVQRGRDHGLADYNSMRIAYGLPAVTSFAQITSDTALAAKLQALYGNVNNIDAWVGGLAETHVDGGSMGPLFTKIIADQFTRLRSGDRLYFETALSPADVATVKATSLSSIIAANTALTTVQSNVFVAP